MVFHTVNGNQKYFKSSQYGFTLIELMIVMAIIALLLSIALPRYFDGLDRSKEAVLLEDLAVMRDAISHYYGDKGVYPSNFEILVGERYLRFIPIDPITESSESWEVVSPPDGTGGVFDIHSGSLESARNGTLYSSW
ncbi:MAG: type II secretion system protein [Methylotenera sp.]